MAENQKTAPASASELSVEDKAFALWHSAQESWKKNQGLWMVVLVAVVCAAAAAGFHTWKKRDSLQAAHRLYGKAIAYSDNGKMDSATAILNKVLAGYSGPEAAKAALELGHTRYLASDWAGALAKYQRAKDDASGYPLLDAAARRGVAASLIELGRFAEAQKTLEGILSSYQKLTGDPAARSTEEEPQDVVPGLEQVMWQLILVLDKQGKAAEAAPLAEKLVRLYPGSQEVGQAKFWLAYQGKVSEVR
jgi:tetratricopeptide (TPR) repeat protein